MNQYRAGITVSDYQKQATERNDIQARYKQNAEEFMAQGT